VGESWSKITHVIAKLRAGHSIEEAIMSAKAYLFDYGDLTPIERVYLKRMVPFYTWTRKNIPLQIKSLIQKPSKVATLEHVRHAISNSSGLDDDQRGNMDTILFPEWRTRRMWFHREKPDGVVEIWDGVGTGFEDLSPITHPTEFITMLHPALRMPLELPQNHEFIRNAPMDANEIAWPFLRHFEHVPGGKAMLDWMSFRAAPDKSGDVKYYRADPFVLALLRSLPLTGAGSRFGSYASRFEDDMLPRSDRPDPQLRGLTGIRHSRITPKTQVKNFWIRVVGGIQDKKEDLVREGILRRLPNGEIIPRVQDLMNLKRIDRNKFVAMRERHRFAMMLLEKEREAIDRMAAMGVKVRRESKRLEEAK